ncbi:MAG: zinc ribbon domain-containing protein [Candidatus Heimdallarchaeota archaeon]|nr:zinc ribbon domain-containing protein [Candidatus Heimdallarchaeota archaeon]MBY8993603.1 zinc ribbon domain-containing protein [Candidatus Heimdallarchaeota archaeon]
MSEEYDYRLDAPSADRIDEITETRVLVAKSVVTEEEAKTIFEKEKVEVFKGFFRRPKEIEIDIKQIVKSYEPYMLIGGKYHLRYLTQRTYDIDLIDDAISVFILGEEIIVPEEEEVEEEETEVDIKGKKRKGLFDGLFKSDKSKKTVSKPEIQLTGIEHVLIEKDIMEARNYKGSSINPDVLPDTNMLEGNEQFLRTNNIDVPKDYVDIEKFTKELIEEFTQKPDTIQRVISEKLTITDKKVLYYPVFWAKMIYKDSKEKYVRLDAITRKVEAPKGTRYAPPPDSKEAIAAESSSGVCPECGEDIESDDVYCENCGVKL